jgi:predicted CXXCH cytochrome family protein
VTRIVGRYELQDLHSRGLVPVCWRRSDGRCRASWSCTRGCECTLCHAAKVRGKSVHSVMATSCDVCHVTQTQGDMTMVSLSMPKQKICFACHQESTALQEHVPAVKGQCVDCHDAHSSDRKMLLRVVALSSQSKQR